MILKVARVGDDVVKEEFIKYQDKSINQLFVEFDDRKLVLKKLIGEIMTLAVNSDVAFEQKFSSMQDMISTMASNFGFNKEISNMAQESIIAAMKFINKDQKLSKLCKLLMDNSNSYLGKVSVICTHVGVAIIENSDEELIKNKENQDKIVMASLLQDISLDVTKFQTTQDYKRYLNRDSKLGSEAIANFFLHPSHASALLLKNTALPLGIDKIVSEHHELPDGSGYPRKLSGNRINILSNILIIGNCVADMMLDPSFQNTPAEIEKMLSILEKKFGANKNFKNMLKALKASSLFN